MQTIEDPGLIRYVHLKLAAMGHLSHASPELEIAAPLLRNYQQKSELLRDRLCPVDARIQVFLDSYLGPAASPRLPSQTLVLDRPGLAGVVSLPPDTDLQVSPWLRSYRIKQGVLHNPRSDRRTTKGIFHIAEGGLPFPPTR